MNEPTGAVRRLRDRTAEETDEQLFAAYQRGREAAFEAIHDRWRGRIHGYLNRRLPDPERVEELTQDTFLRVHRSRLLFDPSMSFSSWIYTIVANLLRNEYRNRKRRRSIPFSALLEQRSGERDHAILDFVDPNPGPDMQTYTRELRDAIESTLQQLEEHHRVPLLMKETGHTFEEIADRMAIPVNTAKSRVIRARGAFRNLFPIAA